MFHKTITLIQKARKWIDTKSVELGDYQLISNQLSDDSYVLTNVINDLVRIDRIIKKLHDIEKSKK